MYNRRTPIPGSYAALLKEKYKKMNYLLPVLISLLVLALVLFITYKVMGRQLIALAVEKKPMPPKLGIFAASLVTTLSATIAIISTLLIMFAPFLKITFAGTADTTQTVLLITLFGSMAFGTAAYWLFVKLGYFSWKVFNLD